MAEKTEDRRKTRTRNALLAAFNDLILKGRKKTIGISDVIEKANVGRSTFYEHYSNAQDLHMQALARPLSILADAATGQGDTAKLQKLLEHFWENRQRARDTFYGQRDQVGRLLAGQIEERLEASGQDSVLPRKLASMQIAESALAVIRGWIGAEASCDVETLAISITRTTNDLRHSIARCDPPSEGN
ncbi:TetR/AcrR family transcriptional regulator [Hyphococcus flavus]|uniref:TetR/AcrR family transcriptional regulator n=1 Tax=Hyphococcus flavus TaxID=1866326 RepID=A0AAF0CG44_9PROT|nr:TetR/AcrR family transcriptional regulator [Hyphococcus flavus]WDI33086.1 TetR/AcrR family transcriptional regulator [Hyphococcus flavus]